MGFLGRLFGGKKSSPPASSSSSQPKTTTNKKKKNKSHNNNNNKHNKKLWNFIRSLNLTNNNTRLALPYHHHNNNNNNNALPLPIPLPHGGHIDISSSSNNNNMDPNKHAIAVAVATAAVAEAALAAAQAAAEVVRLTSAGVGGSHAQLLRKESAAVKIQSAFRAYLARRALRALRALVKLQALARGFLVRKQMANMLKRMQTLVQVQARARASRSGSSSSSSLHSTSKSSSHRPHMQRYSSHANPGGLFDTDKTRLGSNLLDLYMDESMWNHQKDVPARNTHDDEKSAKVLEVDTWKPHSFSPQKNRNFKAKNHAFASDNIGESFRAFDSPSKRSMNLRSLSKEYPRAKDDLLRYAENISLFAPVSSRPGSSSSRREQPFSPTRSEASWGYFSGYSGHPNYMTNTESSRAKVRSQSAPKQRIEFDRTGLAKRSLQGSWDYSEMESGFCLHGDYWNKTYQVPSYLNGHGRPNLR